MERGGRYRVASTARLGKVGMEQNSRVNDRQELQNVLQSVQEAGEPH